MKRLFGDGPDEQTTLVRSELAAADTAKVAGPWAHIAALDIPYIKALGFDRASEDMLVVTSNGQSVICGQTGDILYRNRDEDGFDAEALKGTRLDHPANERFDMAGLFGGGLRTHLKDGWKVEQLDHYRVLTPALGSIHFRGPSWDGYDHDDTFYLLDRSGDSLQVLGFSWTGRTLVCATSKTLNIWGRPAPLTL
ncbi:hypothetical protein Q4555_04090 [Octadecabacter sp. 1_MG-2023]|uniref:hypothetical protein n=1 Tax=unclassified Octadecabacter TaxID=196158 RepID=UPI001C0987A5|nr:MULTISPECIES: hypothetical protein [unclassified Octadecabacter]MBU2992715.1 hypothetical protein [Octadecabacter sp. B2R22]MDO6733834.1 hypothetical protein [Octadecabacter sp. 1_MG-2023]